MSIATPFPPALAPTAVPCADASACSRQSLLVRGLRLAGVSALRATFARVLLAVALALAAGAVAAQPALTARAWTLLDVNSGTLLASHRADEPLEPASLAKLMTAYLVFTALAEKRVAPNDLVQVSAEAFAAPGKAGSRMFIEPGKPVTLAELVTGLAVVSGNDAAVALAEHVAGSVPAFVTRMNNEAGRLGLKGTRFANPTGLANAQQYTTAADMARLAARLLADFPEQSKVFALKEAGYGGIVQANRNRLLWTDSSVDGLKTGHHATAGWNLIATATRPQGTGEARFPRRLIAVVLGAPSESARAQDALALLNHGYASFDTLLLYRRDRSLGTPEVWKGDRATVPIGFERDVFVTVPRGELQRLGQGALASQVERVDPLVAPLRAGERVGMLRVTLAGRTVSEVPIVALANVGPAGFFGRAYDAVRLMLRN
jgi:D-alanyl-D-alanine carboxypeptidase (penicillin-binding protein 5/6)